ncbi:MAG: DUF3298 and DUF4163 domain-containing protein [Actinomycetia bacterium]|nr:DUF3298 and DUF4163 domain-containing protein [Actinomycetes bacterium]
MGKRILTNAAALLAVLIVAASGCAGYSNIEPADTPAQIPETENKARGQEAETEPSSPEGSAAAQETSSDVMYFSDDADFIFVYPLDRTILSSSLYVTNPYAKLNLVVQVQKIENLTAGGKGGKLQQEQCLQENDQAYEPSLRTYEIDNIKIKEYMTLSRGNPCNIVFERHTVFYNQGCRVEIILSADKDSIISSMEEYFNYDNQDCGTNPVWDLEKQQDFYQNVVEGRASGPAQEWNDSFDLIIDSLKINDYGTDFSGNRLVVGHNIFKQDNQFPYQITAAYPELQTNGNNTKGLNDLIVKDNIDPMISDFEDMIEQTEDMETVNQSVGYMPSVDYSLFEYEDNFVSLLFYIYPYTGGAHGMQHFQAINYSFNHNSIIDLEHIFMADFNYLEFLSEYCFEDLKEKMQIGQQGLEPEIEWKKSGTAPTKENFSQVLITKEGPLVNFLPYQVTPYAAGDFTVTIPYRQFESHVDKQGIAGKIFTLSRQ